MAVLDPAWFPIRMMNGLEVEMKEGRTLAVRAGSCTSSQEPFGILMAPRWKRVSFDKDGIGGFLGPTKEELERSDLELPLPDRPARDERGRETGWYYVHAVAKEGETADFFVTSYLQRYGAGDLDELLPEGYSLTRRRILTTPVFYDAASKTIRHFWRFGGAVPTVYWTNHTTRASEFLIDRAIVGPGGFKQLNAGRFVPHTARLLHFVAVIESVGPRAGTAWIKNPGPGSIGKLLASVGRPSYPKREIVHSSTITGSSGREAMKSLIYLKATGDLKVRLYATGFSVMEAL